MGLVCGFMLNGQRMSPAVSVKQCHLPSSHQPSNIPGGEFNWTEKEDTDLKQLHSSSDGKESACKFQSLGMEDPLEKEMATTPMFLSGKSHGWRNLAGYRLWDCKDSDITEQLTHMHIKGIISMNPDSSIFPYVEKHYIGWDVCFFAPV